MWVNEVGGPRTERTRWMKISLKFYNENVLCMGSRCVHCVQALVIFMTQNSKTLLRNVVI